VLGEGRGQVKRKVRIHIRGKHVGRTVESGRGVSSDRGVPG